MHLGKSAWPDLYRIVLVDFQGQEFAYTVATWFDQGKAIALAASEHTKRFKEEQHAIYKVLTEPLGPAPRAANGTASLEGVEVMDRFEF